MIIGFEEQTKDLSDEEKRLARIAWRAIAGAFRSGTSITNGEIASYVQQESGVRPGGPRIRKMINWMHVEGHLPGLVADSKGYRQAKTHKELAEYASSLESRIGAIRARWMATQRDLRNYNQQELF